MAVKDENFEEQKYYYNPDFVYAGVFKRFRWQWARTSPAYKAVVYVLMVLAMIIPILLLARVTIIGGIIIGVVFECIIVSAAYKMASSLYKPMAVNSETGQITDTSNAVGDANLANESEAEMKDIFKSGNYATLKDNICGVDPKNHNKLLAVRRSRGMNGNVLVFGSPGSGKSVCIAIPTIMQTIRRGESLIVTDPKGELYDKTSLMARAHGYTVKVLNLSPSMMTHSDSVNFMGVIKGDDLKAESFVNTIIDNTTDGKKDFFDKAEQNLLKARVLMHTQEGSLEKPTLPAVYKALVESSVEDLTMQFEELNWDSPAMGPGSNFATAGDRVQGDVKGGLGVRLGSLNNRILQMVAGEEDIDFTLPGRERCIYYVVFDDTDVTLTFYQALFFSLLFQELKNYADFCTGDAKSLPVKVTFLMDECRSIGRIEGFTKVLSTFRGRNMDIIMIYQNLPQIKSVYPDEYGSIIDCCSTIYCLRTNDIEETAQLISKRSGIKGVVTYANDADMAGDDRKKITPRVVLNPDQVCRIKNDEIIIIPSGHNASVIRKHYYFTHPMCKELKDTQIDRHVPKWMKNVLATGDWQQYKMYGIRNEEDLAKWVEDLTFEEELLKDIELCTEADFRKAYDSDDEEKHESKPFGLRKRNHLSLDDEVKPDTVIGRQSGAPSIADRFLQN